MDCGRNRPGNFLGLPQEAMKGETAVSIQQTGRRGGNEVCSTVKSAGRKRDGPSL
jgi:hypothetical protein